MVVSKEGEDTNAIVDEVVEFYLPERALQGQEVPCHLIWTGLSWTSIEIESSEALEMMEVHNVDEEQMKQVDNTAVITNVEREGYIGLAYVSHRSDVLNLEANVSLVINRRGRPPIELSRKIMLFRPHVDVLSAPSNIHLDDKGNPSEKIRIARSGFGTLLLSIVSAEASEIKAVLPEHMQAVIESFSKDIEMEVSKLIEKYPEYSEIFSAVEELDFCSRRDESIQKLSEVLADVRPSEEFMEGLISGFMTAMAKNTEFEAQFVKPVVEFMKSTLGNHTILVTPFLEIECTAKEKSLVLEYEGMDVLSFQLVKAVVPPVLISSEVPQKIQLGRLIEWRGEN